jgi:hypothetical protein
MRPHSVRLAQQLIKLFLQLNEVIYVLVCGGVGLCRNRIALALKPRR